MAVDTAAVDRALGAMGTTFRLTRLYPPSHPAVTEAVHQLGEALPALASLGAIEWRIGATGLHWQGQHLLPRNAQVAELAGLLYARGVRGMTLSPGVKPDQVLALFGVATGTLTPEDAALGRITLVRGRRGAQRLERTHTGTQEAVVPVARETPSAESVREPALADVPAPPASPESVGPRQPSGVFRLDALPPDVEAKRAIAELRSAASPEEQRGAVERLTTLAPQLLAARDVATVAAAIVALDRLLVTARDPDLLAAIDRAGAALSDHALVARMVLLLGEPQGAPEEREMLVAAVGALATLSVPPVLDAFIATPVDERAPYRAAIRKAADRALEPLQARLADKDPNVVAAAAELMGLTGSPQAVPLLAGLLRHPADFVREAALFGLAEAGGREVSRPAMPSLKDESIGVRTAAVRAIAAGGDPASTTVLLRRLEQESDEGVQAEMLRAVGRLGGGEALEVLARYAEPGGMLSRRSATVRAAAIEGLRDVAQPEARGLLELYSRDKEPLVRKAAEAALK